MPIRHSIWRIGEKPQSLKEGQLESEALLEDMIVASPEILSPEWIIIGRQEDTGHGGRIDLLALAPDGTLILDSRGQSENARSNCRGFLPRSTIIPDLVSAELSETSRNSPRNSPQVVALRLKSLNSEAFS